MERFKGLGIVALLAAVMLCLTGVAAATNYEVDTVSDTTSVGHCTLRDAIHASQGAALPTTSCDARAGDSNTITFAPGLAGDTIKLSSNLPQLIRGKLTIEGPAGGGITIDGTGISQDLLGSSPGFGGLKLSNLGFANGGGNALFLISPFAPLPVSVSNCTFSNLGGSAINAIGGVITITGSTFTGDGNQSSAVVDSSSFSQGGPPVSQTTIDQSKFINSRGIAVAESGSALTITNSTFTGNKAGVQSGAVGLTKISNSLFSGTQQAAFGHSRGAGQVSNCTFSNNANAIFNSGTVAVTTDIVGSTFTGNTGTAIVNDGSAGGDAKVTLLNSTLTGNGVAISDNGGAIRNTNGIVDVNFSTFSNNGPQTFYTYNNQAQFTATILRGNIISGGQSCYFPFPPSRYNDQGYNIYSDASCPMGPGSVSNTNPDLDPAGLGNHGGPTLTIALTPSSPAVAFVPDGQCLAQTATPNPIRVTTDQRGYGRPAPTHPRFCSAGAYEEGAVAPPPGGSGGGIFGFPLLPLGQKILF